MREVLVLLLSLVPAVALAQPVDPEPSAPPVSPPPPAGPAVAPAAPPSYVQPYAPPVYAPPPPETFHRGTTFELNLGVGFIHASAGNMSANSGAALGGANLGVGGWLNDHLALSVRIAGVTDSENGARFTDVFFGPSLQYWIDTNFWIGGGAGLGVLAEASASSTSSSNSETGFSLDLRAGYSFSSSSANTFNISVELDPGWYSINTGLDTGGSQSVSYTGVALLLGYQYL